MRRKWVVIFLLACLFLAFGTLTIASAEPAAPEVTLERTVLASIGGISGGGEVSLAATMGEPITGAADGGEISVGSGYWEGLPPVVILLRYIFLPLLAKP